MKSSGMQRDRYSINTDGWMYAVMGIPLASRSLMNIIMIMTKEVSITQYNTLKLSFGGQPPSACSTVG